MTLFPAPTLMLPATRSRVLGVVFVVLAVLLWSTVSVGTRLLVRGTGVFSVAYISAMRLWTAALVFMLLRAHHARRGHQPFRVPVAHTGWLVLAAVGIFANYMGYGLGLRYTTAGATAVISQLHTIATVLLAAWLLGERLTPRKTMGMMVAGAGVALVIAQGVALGDLAAPHYLLGNLIQVGAALAWPLYAIGQTTLVGERHDEDALMPIFLLAALLATAVLPFTGPMILRTPTIAEWGVLLFLGIGSTALAYWLFAAGLQRIETSEGSMLSVLSPPFTILLAALVLGERAHGNLLAGLGLVLAGLVLIMWRRAHTVRRVRRAAVTAGVR